MVTLVVALVAVAVIVSAASLRVLREYERAVVFRLGRLLAPRGPGLLMLVRWSTGWCGWTSGR
jgi:regulator of protease activity HflC (stomatin/prohibitin superfamily)